MSPIKSALLLAALGLAASAGAADAATLFKGTVIITARTNTPTCVAAYTVGESFSVEYRPNISPELMSVMGPDGGFLVISSDANPSLRGVGTAHIQGFEFAGPVGPITSNTNLSILPNPIIPSTLFVTATGSLTNAGLPGCSIRVRASLAKLS